MIKEGQRASKGFLTGFTLIELLVVIAIIALLMAILMPALARAKKQAKAVACQTGLRQWSLVFSLYTDDNNGNFMVGEGTSFSSFEWMQSTLTYYKDEAMRFCPMAVRNEDEGNEHWGSTYTAWEWVRTGGYDFAGSYGINEFLFNPPPNTNTQWGHDTSWNWRTKNVRGAGNIPVFADCLWLGGSPHHTDAPPDYEGEWNYDFGNNMKRFCINRHNYGINILFLDWSIQRVRLKSLWRLKWSREFDTTYPLPTWPEWMRSLPEPDL